MQWELWTQYTFWTSVQCLRCVFLTTRYSQICESGPQTPWSRSIPCRYSRDGLYKYKYKILRKYLHCIFDTQRLWKRENSFLKRYDSKYSQEETSNTEYYENIYITDLVYKDLGTAKIIEIKQTKVFYGVMTVNMPKQRGRQAQNKSGKHCSALPVGETGHRRAESLGKRAHLLFP